MSEILKVQNLEAKPGEKIEGYLDIAERPAGRHSIPIMLINGTGTGPTLVINGGEHGSEYNGPAGCLTLMKELNPEDIDGRVIIVPVVNTIAFETRWMHGNPIDYRDVTGSYVEEIPKGGSGPPKITYYLTTTFYQEVLKQADFRLNLHGGDIEEDLLTGTMYRKTGDERKDQLNLKLCRAFGWEWIREGLPRVSSSSLEFPLTVGTEAGVMGRCQSDIVSEVVRGCKNVMMQLGMVQGTPIVPPKAKVFNPYHLYAEHGGFFVSNVRAGDIVKKGEILGMIKDLFGNTLEEIVVPTDGIVHMVTSPAIWQGDVVYEVGKDIREIE